MRIRSVALTAVIVALAGCGWTQPGFDAGHTQSNPFETALTAANVGSLEHHTVSVIGKTIEDFFIVGPWLIVNTQTDALAYDRRTCPRADNGACVPVWTRANQKFMSSDGTTVMFFATGINSFVATDIPGTTLWSGQTDAGLYSSRAFGISDGRLLVSMDRYLGHGSSLSFVDVFATVGCGSPTCAPARSIELPSGTAIDPPWAASGRILFSALGAFDLASGTRLWTFSSAGEGVSVAHGGFIYASRPSPDVGTDVFDAAGVTGCSGSPKACQPLRTLPVGWPLSVSDRLVTTAAGASGSPALGFLGFYGTSASGCSGRPVNCPALATTASLGDGLTVPVTTTPHLVFALGQVTGPLPVTNYFLYAIDGGLAQGCSGDPKVCTPIFQFTSTAVRLGQPKVWDGRVYSADSNGALHVFSLPGAIS